MAGLPRWWFGPAGPGFGGASSGCLTPGSGGALACPIQAGGGRMETLTGEGAAGWDRRPLHIGLAVLVGVAPWAGRPLGFPGFSNRRPSPAAAVGAGGSAPRLGLGGELDRLFLARACSAGSSSGVSKAPASSNLRAHSFSAGAAPGSQPRALPGAGSHPPGHRARLRGPGRARRVAAAPFEAPLPPDPSPGLPSSGPIQ